MLARVILLLFSIAGCLAAWAIPSLADYLVLAGPACLASLYLLLRAYRKRPRVAARHIVIDGSNAMHWKDGTPQIAALLDVIGHLTTAGFTPGVVFDANAGYLLLGKYQHDEAMGKHLGLPEDRVIVVGKGTPADPVIVAAARDLGAAIVTNDRYKEWAAMYPEVAVPGHLIRGGYCAGQVWLDAFATTTDFR